VFEALFILLFVVGFSLIGVHFRHQWILLRRQVREKLTTLHKRPRKLRAEIKEIKKECEKLESELGEVSLVYHCLKNMGEMLEFSETLSIFCKSFQERFPFRKGILAFSENQKGILRLGNIYEIEFPERGKTPHFEIKNVLYASKAQKILEKCLGTPQPFLIPKGSLFEGEGKVFPLSAHGDCVGFMALNPEAEWEPTAQNGKEPLLSILTSEFTLEIKKKMLYEKVKEFSVKDSLSGVYLRRYFFQQLEFELNRSARQSGSTSIVLIDINDFKKINDRYGHLVGDHVLKEVAQLMCANSREIDLVGRFGGDEFILMLPNAQAQDAQKVGERFLTALKEHSFELPPEAIAPTVAMGLATAPEDGKNIEDLIAAADKRLYKGKMKHN